MFENFIILFQTKKGSMIKKKQNSQEVEVEENAERK